MKLNFQETKSILLTKNKQYRMIAFRDTNIEYEKSFKYLGAQDGPGDREINIRLANVKKVYDILSRVRYRYTEVRNIKGEKVIST